MKGKSSIIAQYVPRDHVIEPKTTICCFHFCMTSFVLSLHGSEQTQRHRIVFIKQSKPNRKDEVRNETFLLRKNIATVCSDCNQSTALQMLRIKAIQLIRKSVCVRGIFCLCRQFSKSQSISRYSPFQKHQDFWPKCRFPRQSGPAQRFINQISQVVRRECQKQGFLFK